MIEMYLQSDGVVSGADVLPFHVVCVDSFGKGFLINYAGMRRVIAKKGRPKYLIDLHCI